MKIILNFNCRIKFSYQKNFLSVFNTLISFYTFILMKNWRNFSNIYIYLRKTERIYICIYILSVFLKYIYIYILPQSQCHLAAMKLCIARLTALVWVLLANIFIPKPFIYLCYIDDTFVTFSSRNDALSFFHKLNDLHPSLSFTMEEEKSNKLPFLDVLVERREFSFHTSVYIYLLGFI